MPVAEENILTRFRVKNYRGIAFLDTKTIFPNGLPPSGILIKGPNTAGKTSVLHALLAALAAQDIKEDAIRIDADRSDLLVEMSHVTVERAITRTGPSRLVVKDDNGTAIKSPTTWLRTVLGTSLDPIEFTKKGLKEQKAYILSAIPLKVTPEQVAEWTDGWTIDAAALDYSLHGLEVVNAIRKEFYDRRGAKNAATKELEKEQEALEAGAPPASPTTLTIEAADLAAAEASKTIADLSSRAKRVAEHDARTATARTNAAKLIEEAGLIEAYPGPDPEALAKLENALGAAQGLVAANDDAIGVLERQIEELQQRLADRRRTRESHAQGVEAAREDIRAHERMRAAHAEQRERAASYRVRSKELTDTIAATSETAPTEAETFAASAALMTAQEDQAKARAAELRRAHEAKVAAVAEKRAATEIEASKLDDMVTKFTKVIPSQLLIDSNGVPGLTIDEDEVFLDDVRFSKLSGKERMLFAVRLARRLNTRSKILITDGLEAVDDDALPEFIAEATADGYQLIATRVQAGEIEFEAIGAVP